MFVIPRRIPKLYKGFKVILEDGTEEIPTWKIFNGFQINDDPVQNEADKRKGDDDDDDDDDDDGGDDDDDSGLVDAPMKKMKLG